MVFNIGSQKAGVINNVAGEQRIEGGQHGVSVSLDDAASAGSALREILAATDLHDLSEAERVEVHEDAAAIDEELSQPDPSSDQIGTRLERLTKVLSAAGALAGAGGALLAPLTTLAQWLGPLGFAILRLLPIG